MLPTVLLTGFEPFDDEPVNPSREVVLALQGCEIAGHRVAGAILPVAFAATLPLLEELLAAHRPALVLALGLAGGRAAITPERIAVNLIDARIADNDGLQPIDRAVIDDAPLAYRSSLPVKAIVERLRALGIPSALSLSAGSYVCNQVFFALAHLLATRWPHARGGFIHLPWLPQQAAYRPGQPSMALALQVEAIHAAIECALETAVDADVAGGCEH